MPEIDRASLPDDSSPGDRHPAFLPGLLDRLPAVPARAAVFCASRLGDFICATPGFRALRKRLPSASITLIGLPFVRDLAQHTTYFDAFEAFPGFPGIAEQFFNARRTAEFISSMQKRSFDFAVQMHGSGVYSNTFTLMLGAATTAGFVRQGDDAGRLDAAFTWPASLPAACRALSLARFLGCPDCGPETEFPLTDADHDAASDLLRGLPEPLIGIHPGSRDRAKIWSAANFCAAAAAIRSIAGGTVVIVGGPDEGASGERIVMDAGGPARNLAGREPLGEMGAVIGRLSLLLTNDSGPAHIAYALGRPTVTLFGATDPAEWGPPDRSIHRVLQAPGRDLARLPVEDVVRAGLEALREGSDNHG